ncbi:MAG: hypothetical protein WKF84_09815 [Pyrinomonadaceae bacterium]
MLSPVSKGDPGQRSMLLSIAGLLMAVVGLVLLIACANVANHVARARREAGIKISIRLAISAGRRRRLVSQLLTESVLAHRMLGGAVGACS